MPGHILLQGTTVELAARGPKLGRKAFRLFEHGIGDGDCGLHTESITDPRRRVSVHNPRMPNEDRLRYAAAACQTDFGNPADRSGIKPHVDRMVTMIAQAVEGYSPFLPVKLVVFPEFAHAAPVYPTARELLDK